jgi:hypothetical protein
MEFSEIRKIRNRVRPQLKNLVGQMRKGSVNYILHTRLEFNLAQYVVSCLGSVCTEKETPADGPRGVGS